MRETRIPAPTARTAAPSIQPPFDPDSPEALLARGVNLPPQPYVLQQMLGLAESGTATARQVAAVAVSDPGITAALYRAARSPLYARPVAPQSVEQVVVLLGVQTSLAYAQAECLQAAMPGNPGVMERFWARSRTIAQLAELIADSLPGHWAFTPSQAYLAGMFHDCGVPVLMQRFPDYCRSVGVDGQARRWIEIADEDRHFNCDHAVVGFLLARHWRLPEGVAAAVRHHHETVAPADANWVGLVRSVQLAMQIYAQDIGLQEQGMPRDARVAEELGLNDDELHELLDYVRERFMEHQS